MNLTQISNKILQATRKIIISSIIILTLHSHDVKAEYNLNTEFDNAFNLMIADPSNIELTMNYFKLAKKIGDFEAAIPPLERILFFNPKLDNITLELGIMYHKLKSYEVAKTYFNSIKNSIDSQIKESANNYLASLK